MKNYVIIKNAITTKFCDRIIKKGEELINHRGPKPGTIDDGKVKENYRNCNITWIRHNNMPGIGKIIKPIVQEVNDKQSWGYTINDKKPFKSAQYTTYDKDGHYTWHRDSIIRTSRIISVTLLLNNYGKDFEGGEFEILDPHFTSSEVDEITNKGDMIVFKSNLLHRVKPVTSGHRKSLVIWFLK